MDDFKPKKSRSKKEEDPPQSDEIEQSLSKTILWYQEKFDDLLKKREESHAAELQALREKKKKWKEQASANKADILPPQLSEIEEIKKAIDSLRLEVQAQKTPPKPPAPARRTFLNY